MATALTTLRAWTAAQVAALAFGAWWIGNGIAVFLATESAALGAGGAVDAFGISIAVNGWHGLLHLSTGLAGMALCWRPGRARAYTLTIGVLYLVAAFWGLLIGDTVFDLIRVDGFGSADHAFEGIVLLAAWHASAPAVVRL